MVLDILTSFVKLCEVIQTNNQIVVILSNFVEYEDFRSKKVTPFPFKVTNVNIPEISRSQLEAISIVGKSYLDFCHPEDRDLIKRHFLSTSQMEQDTVSHPYRITGLNRNQNETFHQVLQFTERNSEIL